MKFLLPALITAAAFFSCREKPANEAGEFSGSPMPRLAHYYPLDSLGANGDTLYHTLPAVELQAQDGKPFYTAAAKGKVQVADFFFASCGGICPRMSAQMTRVQDAFRGNPGLVISSYTVDPARDSAAALAAYAVRFNADTAQWKFVTGPKKAIYDLARYGYFLPVEPGNGDSEDFIHSDQFVLLDRDQHIRGYYNGTDSSAVDSLIVDIRTLLNEK
jgi:protein SCO1/2